MTKTQSAIHLDAVEYKDEQTTCVGTLVHDIAHPGRLPGVLLCPTFLGAEALARRKATQIARLGYAVLVMDPYGDGKVASDRDKPRSRATLSTHMSKGAVSRTRSPIPRGRIASAPRPRNTACPCRASVNTVSVSRWK